jgi:hypothetical protein
MDILGLFLLMAGFALGLGSVTVTDVHGLLGRQSPYWMDAAIRAHKVTKPLIWTGVTLAIIGGLLYYRNAPLAGIPLIHGMLAVVLILNGAFLSFYISPMLLQREQEGKARQALSDQVQARIALSFLLSDAGWWLGLVLLAYYAAIR